MTREPVNHLEYLRSLRRELDGLTDRDVPERLVDQETIERIANALKRRETVRNR